MYTNLLQGVQSVLTVQRLEDGRVECEKSPFKESTI